MSVSSNKSKKQLTKNFFSLTVVQIATYVLPLVSVPIVSRIIGPSNYGIINFGAALITYFTLLISYSFDFSATRKIAKNPEDADNRNKVFSEVFYTQCLLFIFSTIVFIILLFVVPQFRHNLTVIIFSYFICISTLFTQNWLFQAMQDLSKVAIFNLLSKLIFTIAILIVIRKNEDYIWQPFLIGVIQIAVSIWSFVWAVRRYKIHLHRIRFMRCIQVLWEEKMIFISLIFINLYTYTSIVILGLYQNSEQVGYYTSAQRLIAIAQSVLAIPLSQALYPFVGKAFGESREQGLRVVQKIIPLILLFLGVITALMFLLGPIAIRLFYGAKFEGAIPVFQILTISPLIFLLNNVLGVQIMLNLGMDRHFLITSASAAVLSISFNLLMVRQWGYIGTTLNALIIETFLLITMYFILRREGLNPINLQYFKISSFRTYINPVKTKLLSFIVKSK